MGTMILQKNFYNEEHARRRNKGELTRYAVTEMFEPLVTPEEYEQAVAIRNKRAEDLPTVEITRFSGLVKCGICGQGISRRTVGARKRWCCNQRERKGTAACDMRPIQESELESATQEVLGDLSDEEFRSTVRKITVFNDRLEISLVNGATKKVARDYKLPKFRNGFSGHVFCANCDGKLGRKTVKKSNGDKVVNWACGCGRLHRIHEDDLRMAACSTLESKDGELAFVENVRAAKVYNDKVEFKLYDGRSRTWLRG